MGYRDYQVQIAPPWLRGPVGSAWLRASGDGQDELADRARAAVKARLPGHGPTVAMQIIGEERGVERLPGDTDEAYATRVRGVWSQRRWAGTPYGVLLALADIGYPTAHLMIHRGRDYSLSGGALATHLMVSGRWVMDAREAFWSQFEVLLPAPHPWAVDGQVDSDSAGGTMVPGGTPDAAWGVSVTCTTGGTVASGAARLTVSLDSVVVAGVVVPHHGIISCDNEAFGFASGVEFTLGGTLVAGDSWQWTTKPFPNPSTSQEVLRIRRVIRRWKPAFATCRGIVVHTAGNLHGWPHYATRAERTRGGSMSHNRVVWSA
jgi:hypothetical protein